MRRTRAVRTLPGSLRRALLTAMAVAAVGAAACGVDDGPSGPGASIQGTWFRSDAQGDVYFRITATEVTVLSDAASGECYVRNDFQILDRDASLYRLRDLATGAVFEVVMERSDDDLVVSSAVTSVTFERSEVDVDALETCVLETSCEGLPVLQPGDTLAGTLSAADPTNPDGSHYDMYALTLAGSTTIRIDMASDSVDAYLAAFTEQGGLLGEDDDGGEGTNARLTGTLDAGCYAVMATSFEPGELGGYTISVTIP